MNKFFEMKKLKIHHWILIAFLLGIVVGIIFKKNENRLVITYGQEDKQRSERITFTGFAQLVVENNQIYDTISFKDVRQLVKFVEKNTKKILLAKIDGKVLLNVKEIKFAEAPLKFLSPLGTLFLRLLSFLAIPLVISSMIVGVASLGNIKTLGRIGSRTILFYIITTGIAVIIGIAIAITIKPGEKITPEVKAQIEEVSQEVVTEKLKAKGQIDIVDFFVNIVPANPFKAISNGEMLPIIFFAIFVGIGLTLVEPSKSQIVISFFDTISNVFIRMVKVVLWFAPFGVFALIAVAVSDFGVPILSTLGYYMFCVILGLAFQFFVVYSVLIWLFARINPMIFYSGLREAFIVAFTTSSSAATLPVTFQCVEENLGVPNKIASFVLPLGATVNMNGTSLYQAVAAIFIAQFYGLDLSYSQLATILLTSMLAAVGTAPVPGVGIIMLIMVLQSVGIPAQGIGLILGVDRILDMLRTIPNIAGDAVVSLIVWKMETKKSK